MENGDRSELLPALNFSQSNASAGVVWRGREIKLNLYNHMELNSDGRCVHENVHEHRTFRVNISVPPSMVDHDLFYVI